MQMVRAEPTVLRVGPADPHLVAVLGAGGFRVLDVPLPEGAGAAAAHRPDVVLIDLDAGTSSAAVEAIETLTGTRPGLPVLALSTGSGAAQVLAAVRAGAVGYVLRTASASKLVDAVRRTAAGEAVFSPGLAAAVLDEHTRGSADGPVRLTEREADVLRMVVAGYTARQIAGRLVLSPRTVENHVQHMLRKLNVPNRAALVRHAIENGLA